ncbi:MAG TPA: HEPN domain-containing protein [Anaerolineae bacterium]|nr:HEPN domain-containing protein [Anaerolineae bacterium]
MAVSEIQLYLDRAHQDLQAAKSNFEQGFYGVTVTRAYYAMFYSVSALLASKGLSRRKHSGVISAFGEYFVKPGLIETEFAKMLGNAFTARLGSDYDLLFTVEPTLAEGILQDAQQFIDRVEHALEHGGE